MDSPLHITIYDKKLVRTGWCEDFVEHHVTPRHLALGTADLTVPTDYRNLAALAQDGARAVIELERDGTSEHVMSGKIRGLDAEGNSKTGLTTFSIEDDFRVFYNLLGYPAPGTPQPDAGGALTQAAVADVRSGPAEDVVKAYLSANLARWAGRTLPYTVAPSLGRGATLTNVSIRMQTLAEKLLPLLDGAGVGFTVRQALAGLVVDAYATQRFPITLSEDGGTVDTWKIGKTPYSRTAGILGGPNAGTSREFRLVVDAAREARFFDVIEALVDVSSETITSKMMAAGVENLTQADDVWSVELTLTESSIFRYGGPDGIHVGDQVDVDFSVDLPPISAAIGEAELAFDQDDGYSAKFTVGPPIPNPDDTVAEILQQLVTAVHEIRAQ